MKKSTLLIFFFLFMLLNTLKAQQPIFTPIDPNKKTADPVAVAPDSIPSIRPVTEDNIPLIATTTFDGTQDSIASEIGPQRYGWTVDPRTGNRTFVDIQKTLLNFHQANLVDGQSVVMSYLGNTGSPAQSQIFFDRKEGGLFPFLNVFDYTYKTAEKNHFLNTNIPYSNMHYSRGGGRTNQEERFKGELSTNFGKKINVGINIDYIYSRGFYNWLSNKQVSYDLYGSYISDKYQMHFFGSNNNYNNSENGGIIDDRFITDPNNQELESLGLNSGSKDIPTRFEKMWNRLKGRQIFLSNKYNVGYETEGENKEFIPVASFILTNYYKDQQRRFHSNDDRYAGDRSGTLTDSLYNNANNYVSNSLAAEDQMAYWSFKNTLAISVNEGFKKWAKFGLTAFIEQDFRKFSIPSSLKNIPKAVEIYSQNSTVIGGMLTKQKGKYLNYNLSADLGVIGYNAGEFNLSGDISANIRFAGKNAVVRAKAHVKNTKPTFFENHFYTKYIKWDNNFKDTRRIFAGGEIIIPQANTRLSGGVESIENYLYYTENSAPRIDGENYDGKYIITQSGKNVQVISLRLDQKLKAGIFHWDNQIVYQLSSEKDVLPLPSLSFYTNVYLLTKVVKVLTVQLGVDAHFHTKYYAQGYDPAIMQFYNQKEIEVGGFPISTAYLNVNLKNTRFFFTMYNIAESIGNSEYFTLPHYPVNPMYLRLGFSWDFNN